MGPGTDGSRLWFKGLSAITRQAITAVPSWTVVHETGRTTEPRPKCPPRWDGPSADLWGSWKGWRGIHCRHSLVSWALSRRVEPVPVEDRLRLAAYLANCTTESSDAGDALHRRLARDELASLDLGEHLRRLVQVAWDLGAERALNRYGLRQGARTLSNRGHWLTKSPYRSTRLWVPARHAMTTRPGGHVTWRTNSRSGIALIPVPGTEVKLRRGLPTRATTTADSTGPPDG
jgi:hypothetical protein